ncbi:MAG: ATP-binding protein [Flavobacterium sp.]|nr:ATP-binding protein [Flavobacterium sp.]
MTKHNITIPGNGKELAGFSGEFARINIILGGNGTGKSKLLNALKTQINSFGLARQLIYVEGGRAMTIPDSLQLSQVDFNNYKTYKQTELFYKKKRPQKISTRIKDALILLEQKEQEINNEFARNAHNWDMAGRTEPFPQKPQAPLEKLFEIFNEVFPSITLQFNTAQKALRCFKNGNEYGPSQLSDGEKQIFCLLADIFMLAEPLSLILVDEPELNLNPGLACRFWDIIENELPEAVFIYATHCVSFSMRNHVEKIIVLGKNSNQLTSIENISELHSDELRELLGAIPAILSSSSALAVEGKENSFDQSFYRWLLNNNDLEVIPVGGCAEVNSVANKKGIWEKIAPAVKIGGVIDCDHRSEQELTNLSKGNISILEYHEVESYFCDPKLICEIGNALSVNDVIPTEEEITNFILDDFLKQINIIAAQRTFSRANIRLAVSIEKSILCTITSEDELKDLVKKESQKESQKADETIGETKTLQILSEELERCKKAHTSKDMEQILLLIPGKQLLHKLAPKAGCRSDRNFANAVKKHINVQHYPKLIALKENIEKLIK